MSERVGVEVLLTRDGGRRSGRRSLRPRGGALAGGAAARLARGGGFALRQLRIRGARQLGHVLAGFAGKPGILLHEAGDVAAGHLVQFTAGDLERGQRDLEGVDMLGGLARAGGVPGPVRRGR